MTTVTAGGNRLCRTAGRARTKNREGPGDARGILNFGQLSPHTRTWPADTTAAAAVAATAVYTCGVLQPAAVRVDFVHGVGGQKSHGRRTLMPVRACVRVCVRWKYTLVDWKKGTPPPPPESDGVRYGMERGSGGRWFLKYIDKRVEASSAVAAAG